MPTPRETILANVRRHHFEAPGLPDLNLAWTTYPDRKQQFADVLTTVGGRFVSASSPAQAHADLIAFEPYASGKKTVSLVPGIGATNFDLAAVTDPHELEDVDFAVLPGTVAVAENAAVWVTDEAVPFRVLYFLPQHLQARPFGCWVSGPSKTADIEQSLVIGAHGARSMTVYMLDDLG
jgi:L-lactate dehydrogenase complex protein LldG